MSAPLWAYEALVFEVLYYTTPPSREERITQRQRFPVNVYFCLEHKFSSVVAVKITCAEGTGDLHWFVHKKKKRPRMCVPRLRRLTKVAPNRTNPRLKLSRSTLIYTDMVSTSLTYERGLWIWVVGTYNVLFSVQEDSVFSLEKNNTPLCTFKFCLKPTVESNQTIKMYENIKSI